MNAPASVANASRAPGAKRRPGWLEWLVGPSQGNGPYLRQFASWIYLMLAVPAFLVLVIAFPNFHAPDDPDHFKRAASLLDRPFEIVTPPRRNSGVMIDAGLQRFADAQFDIAVRPDRQWVKASGRNQFEDIGWTGVPAFSEMPGAALYLPVLYAPQSAAIAVGKSLGMTIADTVLLARLANGATAIVLTWLGLAILPQGHALVLALLFLPRTILQYASNSADPLLFAVTLLVIGVALRADLHRKTVAVATAAGLWIAAAVRPPLAALALLPIGLGLQQRRFAPGLLAGGAVLAAAAWTLWAIPQVVDNRCLGEKGSLTEQAASFVLHLPLILPKSFAEHGGFYYFSLVAHYGFGNGPAGTIPYPMPSLVYSVAIFLLAWAVRLDLADGGRLPKFAKPLLCVSAAAMVLMTFFAMYIACTAFGSYVVAGVQGRYFIPALFALAPVIAGTLERQHAWPWRPYAVGLVCWVSVCVALMVIETPVLYRL